MKEQLTGQQVLQRIQRFEKPRIASEIQLGKEIPPASPTTTGDTRLDELLGGGWQPGLNLIYGHDGAGKSRVAAETVIAAAKRGQISVWISTDEVPSEGQPLPSSLQYIESQLTESERKLVVYKSAHDADATPAYVDYVSKTFLDMPEPPIIVIDPVGGVNSSEDELAKYSYLDVRPEEEIREEIDVLQEQPIHNPMDRALIRETRELSLFLSLLHHRATRAHAPVLVVAHAGNYPNPETGKPYVYENALDMTLNNTGAPRLGVLRHLPRIAVFVEDLTVQEYDEDTKQPIFQPIREVAITPVKAHVMGARPLVSIEDQFETIIDEAPKKQKKGVGVRYIQSFDDLRPEK